MTFVHNAQWTGQSQGEEEGTEWMATRVAWPRTRRGRSQRQEAAEGGGSQEEGVTQLEQQELRHQRGGALPGFSDPNPRKCFWNESKYKETSLMTQK